MLRRSEGGLDCRPSTYLAIEGVVVVVERRVAELGRWCISRPSTPGVWVMVGLWDRWYDYHGEEVGRRCTM